LSSRLFQLLLEPFSLFAFFITPLLSFPLPTFPLCYFLFALLFPYYTFSALSSRYLLLFTTLFFPLQDEKSGPLSPASTALAPVFSGHFRSQLALHPAFYDIYERCESHLLAGDGPLPYDYRHYIAILVSHEQVSQGFGEAKSHCMSLSLLF
jgi:hypothetical protein